MTTLSTALAGDFPDADESRWRALAEKATTRDLGGTLGTMEFADALIKRL